MSHALILGGSGFFGKSILDSYKRGLLREQDIDQITIYNANGEMLSNVSVSGAEGSFEISDLSSGVYFIKLAYKESVFKTEKLVVSN